MASTPAKRNATTSPIAGTAYVNELNDALGRAIGPTTGLPDAGSFGRIQRYPAKVVGFLLPVGVYSINVGTWKAQIDETATSIATASLFDFTKPIQAVGIVLAELNQSIRSLVNNSIIFVTLLPSESKAKKPVFEILSPPIIDVRLKSDKTQIQVSYDGTNWVDKIATKLCS